MIDGSAPDGTASRLPSLPADLGPVRAADVVVSTVLWLGLSALSAVAGVMALLLVMAADGCGTSSDDGALLCGDGGGLLFFLGIAVLWLVLATAVLGSALLIVRGAIRRRRTWHWPLVGLVVGVAGCAAMIGWMVVLTR
ncbi:hypothetical protein [Aeromicrobium sp. Leaf272]|uniref:hypothetical protein n=1 Tax=Aeromicrobium sp. Leaf272 TaxID=1736317 RepID=UPI0006F930B7|nr:hypothetical protein [Aeromicrobium sp. Leaf272]KQP27709.1 hypothetical protein ASF38_02290 [Aeromicrobium sp. Leaf272]